MMKLVLLRHGESKWNLENKFTGWHDVDLTNQGEKEAIHAGKQILKQTLDIKSIYTSYLIRAERTAEIVSDIIKYPKNQIHYNWRLNERHYGALQGLNKSETASKYGEEQVKIWRRSFDISPPSLNDNDSRHPRFNEKFKDIEELPSGESLKQVINRLRPFFKKYTNQIKKEGGDHLIVAHSNSLRAIIKIIEKLSSSEIMLVEIPTGIPLVYSLNEKLEVLDKQFLISEQDLLKKQKMIINQGKAR